MKKSRCSILERLLCLLIAGLWVSPAVAGSSPNVLILTVDTLRVDRLSGYGYDRPTSPEIDQLMASGVRFDSARTPEPLTAPALASMWTGLQPHEHGCSRNGLSIHEDLPSLSKVLHLRGYETAAFVGNWTLRDKLSKLGEHFGYYGEIFSRKRWFGLMKGEATAEDLNRSAVDWLEDHHDDKPDRPFLIWVHYVEPHEPYRLWPDFAERLGYDAEANLDDGQRYDTEIAHVDARIGELLRQISASSGQSVTPRETLIVFAADHGESLGEHGYWGHGRNLMEPNLQIPLSLTWPGRIEPGVVAEDAVLLDVPRTVLGLLDLPSPRVFGGVDWSQVLLGHAEADPGRVTFYQSHKGAVQPTEVPEKARRRGLLSIARVENGKKTVWRLDGGRPNRLSVFELDSDAAETTPVTSTGPLPDELEAWLATVFSGLERADADGSVVLDEETIEQLKALGYLD